VIVPEIGRVPVTDRAIIHVRFLVPEAGEELMLFFNHLTHLTYLFFYLDHLNVVSALVPTAMIDKYRGHL
jgi:hypothetical protein